MGYHTAMTTASQKASGGRRGGGYDDIVVGSGSAGCVLARRLADAGRRVLVLEAGPRDKVKEIHIPAGFPKLFRSALDWNYETEPEDHLDGRRLFWPRGRVVGGCSSINAMLYIRGHRADYDRWRDQGNQGWGWDDVLPRFKRSEDQQRGASEYHGTGGPLTVGDPRDPNPLSHRFVAAGAELGFERNEDFNGAEQEGFGIFQVTQRAGKRCSAAVAFLHPAVGGNLELRSDAPVARVLFEGSRAVGVELQRTGEVIRADGEVILCAGAIGSPQLLMLSGVGPADALRELGIDVVADLSGVGENLQDHPVVPVIYRAKGVETLDEAESFKSLVRYLLWKRGPYTSTICEAGAFVRSREGLDRPDLQLHFLPAALTDHGVDRATHKGFNFGPTLVLPESRGRITLRSADPAAMPRIWARYLSVPGDVEVLVAGIKLARRLAATEAFAEYAEGEVLPGPNVEGDEALAAYVHRIVETLYHPVGTCRMGPESALDSERPPVVDADLRVHGVEGLRVVDASIMPEITAGNTNAPTLMIAEMAADRILGRAAS